MFSAARAPRSDLVDLSCEAASVSVSLTATVEVSVEDSENHVGGSLFYHRAVLAGCCGGFDGSQSLHTYTGSSVFRSLGHLYRYLYCVCSPPASVSMRFEDIANGRNDSL